MTLLIGTLMTINSVSAVLSATTANTIQGTKPRLSATHINAINAGKDFSLLGVKFNNNSYFTRAEIKSVLSIPPGVSFGDLTPNTLAQKLGNGIGQISAAYKMPIPQSGADALDADGDRFAVSSLTGSASANWYYMNGSTESVFSGSDLNKSFCDLALLFNPPAPYIKIEGSVQLTTAYGYPLSQVYDIDDPDSPISGGANNPVRRFYLGNTICYVQPSYLSLNTGTSVWVPGKGFKVISETNGSLNFPRTAFNGAAFKIKVAGVDVRTLTFPTSITKGNVKATISTPDASTVKVELSGPSSGQANGYPMAKNYCDTLAGGNSAYRVPKRVDYTNSPAVFVPTCVGDGTGTGSNALCLFGAYSRAIGNGIFTEWGSTTPSYYGSSDWENVGYWTSEFWDSDNHYIVSSDTGAVFMPAPTSYNPRGACVSP